jgi:plasmid segregation protein ParM
MYIALDSGKHTTKATTLKKDGTEKCLVFRTKMEETSRNEAQGQSYIVAYNGKNYLIGEQAEVNSAKSSKAEVLHRICTYTALHQIANTGDELVVAIGCPLATYENPESRKAYKDFMFPDKEIDIKVGDTTKHLKVLSVIVLPESSGVIHLEPE